MPSALILDFRIGEERRRSTPDRLDIGATLAVLEATVNDLERHGIEVLGFGANARGPLVAVQARPQVYQRFRNAETWRRTADVVVWQAFTAAGVRILWEERLCAA